MNPQEEKVAASFLSALNTLKENGIERDVANALINIITFVQFANKQKGISSLKAFTDGLMESGVDAVYGKENK